MQNCETPTKPVKKGRKPIPESQNDFCRFCNCSLKVWTHGDTEKTSYLSTENLFKVPHRKEYDGTTLVEICKELGFNLSNSVKFSQRVCKACGRNLRSTHRFYKLVKSKLEEEIEEPEFEENSNTAANNSEEETDYGARCKRQLPTTVSTPERSPQNKKILRKNDGAKKSLLFGRESHVGETDQDKVLSELNIEELVNKTTTQLKVVIVSPNGRVETRSSFLDDSKAMILNIVRGKWSTVANFAFKHPLLRNELLDPLKKTVDTEFKEYCRDSSHSILQGITPSEISRFSNQLLVKETESRCPFWMACLQGASNSREENKKVVNFMALSTATAARSRNQKMSALAYRTSTVLFHSGARSEDIERLNKLGICMSPDMTVEFQRKMGESCRSKVIVWKSEIERKKLALLLLKEVEEKNAEGDLDFAEDKIKEYTQYDQMVYTHCKEILDTMKKGEFITKEDVVAAINQLSSSKLPSYKLVGDNIDLMVHARIQSSENQNQSIHWTQQYAVVNRVNEPLLDTTTPRKAVKDIQLVDLLPVKPLQEKLVHRWAVLVGRVVCRYLPKFSSLLDVVVHHIPHKYSKEMTGKSESCSLGVEFLNPNIAGDMAQLLISNQEKYVPAHTKNGKSIILETVPLHGDQLFEERARNTQWTYQVDGDSPFDRLEGIETEFADWHAKYNLYMLEFDTFVKDSSAAEIGTSRASMNRTRKTNAAKRVETHYNEYKEFHQREVEAHICASFMEMSGMHHMEDSPNYILPDNTVSKENQRKWLMELCINYVEKYVIEREEVQPLVQQMEELEASGSSRFLCRIIDCDKTFAHHSKRVKHEVEKHGHIQDRFENGEERDAYGYYHCRATCGLVFSTKCIRNRHEKTLHPQNDFTMDQQHEANSMEDKKAEDFLFNYHRSKLVLGLTLFEFDDAIKEGDGERLHELYKFAILLYKAHGKTKYAYVILLYLVKIAGMLSEKEAHQLKWNRFFNKHGTKAGNIPLDLRMEHMNKIVKTMWKALGPNINEQSAERLANTLEPVELIMDGIDKDCGTAKSKGYRSQGKPEIAVEQITKDLVRIKAFEYQPGRIGHPSFLRFPSNLLKKLDYRDLHSWMTGHIKTWESVYDLRA